MKKLFAYFKKHKAIGIGSLSLIILLVFWLFMKGRTALSGGSSGGSGALQITPNSNGGGSAIDSGGQSVGTGTDSTSTDNGSILTTLSNAITQLFNKQADISTSVNTLTADSAKQKSDVAALSSSVGNVNSNVNSLQSSISSVSNTVNTGISGLSSKIDEAVNLNKNNAAPAPTIAIKNQSALSDIISAAQTAISNAHVLLYSNSSDPSTQHSAAFTADNARAGVLNAVKALGSGYSATTVDSGAGYSNVVVTTPDGKTIKL